MTIPLDNIVVVLDHPQDPLNIGAVVRAMKNMGIHRLRLVQPVPFARGELLRLAHRCDDIVDQIAVHGELAPALADAIFVVGADARLHGDAPTTSDMRALAADLIQRAANGPVVLLFGAEADGLDRAALARCHLVARLPSDPAYPALNLAQAVLIFLYELRMAALGEAVQTPTGEEAVTHGALERLFAVSEEALGEIGFFKYHAEAVMHALRRMAYRKGLSSDEVALLMAIARQVMWSARNK